MADTPFEKILNQLLEKIPEKRISLLPDKWEKIGDVVLIKLPKELKKNKKLIGKTYADILNSKTVLLDTGGIAGEYREPITEIIYGEKNCVTIHKENKIRYKLDPCKIMFSSGNMDERIRMANISNNYEVVVDLFAGIGYFTLPLAVYSKPKKIFACEKNPLAFDYLKQNIVLNNVTNIIEPIGGDNRKVAPKNVADRVILGFIGNTHDFLSTALSCLKNNSGVIHYHNTFSEKNIPDDTLEYVKEIAGLFNKTIKLLEYRQVKSFAPGVGHYVFDIRIG